MAPSLSYISSRTCTFRGAHCLQNGLNFPAPLQPVVKLSAMRCKSKPYTTQPDPSLRPFFTKRNEQPFILLQFPLLPPSLDVMKTWTFKNHLSS